MTRPSRIALIAGALIVGAMLLPAGTRMLPAVRDRVVSALNVRFSSQVTLATFEIATFPRPAIAGTGLELRYNGRDDVPPLLTVPSFSASAGVFGMWGQPLRLRTVELDGLAVAIPVGGLKLTSAPKQTRPRSSPPALSSIPAKAPQPRSLPDHVDQPKLVIDRLTARSATLEIASRDPAKLPRHFEIHDLQMWDVGQTAGAKFHASLTNPKPRGQIDTTGVFGPWETHEPRLTPLRGDYRFERADLDTIKGIGGILSSDGSYKGVLERIEVSGRTETPDFSIDLARQSLPLTTTFDAVVDGTNGNTFLNRVEATLRETTIIAKGAVVRARDVKGRNIELEVSIDNGRLEDVLALSVNATRPPVTGRMALQTRMVIPAGEEDVIDKLQLNGAFQLVEARFSNLDIQKRVNTLSRRGRGDSANEGPSVVSNLRGRFLMRNASIRFSELTFGVPGAMIQLAGDYDLRSEALNFAGQLLLDASLAETTTGFKSVLARLAQPLFRRPGGGTALPIRISGTRSKPSFGLDVRRAFLPG